MSQCSIPVVRELQPHVKFGAAKSLGIACAGTGLKEAISLIEHMTNDPVNYVRQGALIASAMILIQQNEVTCPRVAHFRQLNSKIISDKHDEIIAKFGAILAQGIVDMPKVELKSSAKPSMFAYPPNLEEKKKEIKDKVETAVLSITAKQKKKEAEKKKEEEKMDTDEKTDTSTENKMKVDKKAEEVKKDEKKDEEKKKEEEKRKEPESTFEMLNNHARIMRAQLKVLSIPESSKYATIKDVANGGIILLKDVKPGEKEEIVEPVVAGGPKAEEEEEPSPPEPFEWTED